MYSLRSPLCRWRYLLCIWIAVSCRLSLSQDIGHRRDPTPLIYPGQVNIAFLANIHESAPPNSTSICGKLREDAVQKAMASVWAAHQVNFRKDDTQDLNIGVYIFDTCGREDVAQRQVYRLLGHVGHVQTTTCSDKRIPPLFAVITEGDADTLRLPSKLLESFGVPVISASRSPQTDTKPNNYLTTAPTTASLARAAVTVLRQLQLLEVAVIAEDNNQGNLFADFSREAQMSGMQALPVDHPSIVGDPDNFLASLQVVSEYGRSRLKAVVFLLNTEQALDLLKSVDSSNFPQMPWVLVTETDLAPALIASFKRHQLRRLQQVLLLSPETTEIPEFQEYFKQLSQEDTIKYHPLLVEFEKSVAQDANFATKSRRTKLTELDVGEPNTTINRFSNASIVNEVTTESPAETESELSMPTYTETDVSSVVKAVWTLAASLKTVQKRSCRRGTDCLLYLRRSLSSYALKAAKTLNYTLDQSSGSESLRDTRLAFSPDGTLSSVRYSLKGFTFRGDIQEVGWYSDDAGLAVDREAISSFNGFVFKKAEVKTEKPPTTTTPELITHPKFQPERIAPSNTTAESNDSTENDNFSSNIGTEVPNVLSLEDGKSTAWKILDYTSHDVPTSSEPNLFAAIDSVLFTTADQSMDDMFEMKEDDIDTNRVFEETLHVIPKATTNSSYKEEAFDVLLGPSYRAETHSASSNLRSVSLTSHHEPRSSNAFRTSEQESLSPRLQDIYQSNRPSSARSIDRPQAGAIPPLANEDIQVISAGQGLHISAWLARPWALAILGLCGFGILVTMYVLVFLMVKSCEGTLKKTNTSVAIAQLISILSLYVGAVLFTWKPSPLQCGLKRLVPNVSYAFCFGCLLLKGMSLKAQNSLGLGGSVNKCNQIITLLFIMGVQVALEVQWWFLKPPAISYSTLECIISKEEIMQSQGYVSFLLILSVIISVSTRKIPYNCQEVRSLIGTSLTCLIVFLAWDIACWLLPDSYSRNIAAPAALITTAVVILIGIFGPQLFAIHKYGGFPHKPLSYADSLSTVFTMFKDLDNASNSGTTGRGKKTAKTLETPFGTELGEGTRNPLYSDYQSAYP